MGVIATGGLAPLFAGATAAIDNVDPDLTLWGLRLIYRRNRNQMKTASAYAAGVARSTGLSRRPNALFFLPLGGGGEIGMNLNLYGYRGQWLMLDCGVTFGDDSHAGRRSGHARSRLYRRAPRPAARDRRDPCARGPYRRHPLSLAAAALPDLGDAVHRLAAAREAGRGRARSTRSRSTSCRCRAGSRSARSTSS